MNRELNRRHFISVLGTGMTASLLPGCQCQRAPLDKPNIVIIFLDDAAYADVGCFGAQGYSTPHIDRMASEGMRFTDFHASTAVCSASRASLMTGCYNVRLGIHGAYPPQSRYGLHENEVLISNILKARGYATAIFGKWHLGDRPKFLPTRRGFDEYFGIPYSNDMWPGHPENPKLYPRLPLMENERVVQYLDDNQDMITTWYTERAVDFINRHAHHPFFLYVPHSMVHVPLFVSDKFRNTTQRGLFGDVMQEVDWSVGQILEALHTNGIDENTLIFFSSDNGPWLVYGDHCGSAGHFREGKGTSWEGGVREPTIMRWPGQIPAGVICDELATTMDMLPTVTKLAGGTLPSHTIDGHDIRPLMFGEPGAQSPWDAFYIYYQGGQLQAVRSGEWKLILPHKYRSLNGRPGGTGGIPAKYESLETELALYNVKKDLGETTDVSNQFPDVVARLQALAEKGREELGDTLTGRKGKGVRPVGEA